VTAGTFFHGIRHPQAWLAAIQFRELGVVVNSNKFAQLFGIVTSTASEIFKKLAIVIQSQIGVDEQVESIHSSTFVSVYSKRSKETPKRQHPRAEQADIEDAEKNQEAIEEPEAYAAETGTNASFDLGEYSFLANDPKYDWHFQEIYALTSNKRMHSSELYVQSQLPYNDVSATLSILELANLVVRLPGDFYIRSTPDPKSRPNDHTKDLSPHIKSTIDKATSFIETTFHGISRKCLGLYLATFWCHFDRNRWKPGELLKTCQKFGPVKSQDVINYVTTLMVDMIPCPT